MPHMLQKTSDCLFFRQDSPILQRYALKRKLEVRFLMLIRMDRSQVLLPFPPTAGKGFGRVRDTLKDFGGLLEYIKNHEGLAISLESIVSEESRNALEALGYMIKYTVSPSGDRM